MSRSLPIVQNTVQAFLRTMEVVGVSVLLLLGSVLVLMHQQPIHRQRVAEATMGVCLVWVILACVPMRRYEFKGKEPLRPQPLSLYRFQPGDEVIAAEVFK